MLISLLSVLNLPVCVAELLITQERMLLLEVRRLSRRSPFSSTAVEIAIRIIGLQRRVIATFWRAITAQVRADFNLDHLSSLNVLPTKVSESIA